MVQPNEDYVLNLLQDVGLVTRTQIEKARAKLNGAANVVDVLVKDGLVSEADVSREPRRAGAHGLDRSLDHVHPAGCDQTNPRRRRAPLQGHSGRLWRQRLDRRGRAIRSISTRIDSLSFLLQREIELVCTSPEKIREALIKYYGTADEAADILLQKIGEDVDLDLEIR